ncbi:Uncharacterised protein [BD1-7 clade bacterium]|uniref:Uncharacterized protein n=1 Tax=BD1-7 clade bacterium TaxID=2029982 RepID=A0A5S9MXV6_9GAMM|nr:Uncharacterised protein [BD1-7 clade bacterium]
MDRFGGFWLITVLSVGMSRPRPKCASVVNELSFVPLDRAFIRCIVRGVSRARLSVRNVSSIELRFSISLMPVFGAYCLGCFLGGEGLGSQGEGELFSEFQINEREANASLVQAVSFCCYSYSVVFIIIVFICFYYYSFIIVIILNDIAFCVPVSLSSYKTMAYVFTLRPGPRFFNNNVTLLPSCVFIGNRSFCCRAHIQAF